MDDESGDDDRDKLTSENYIMMLSYGDLQGWIIFFTTVFYSHIYNAFTIQ